MKVLKYKYNPNKKGVFRVSIVKNPAVGEGDLVLMSAQEIKGVFYAPVMIPDLQIQRIDEDGNKYMVYYDAETVEQVANNYFKQNGNSNTNIEHSADGIEGVYPVESWIVKHPENDKSKALGMPTQKEGTWIMGYKCDSSEILEQIKNQLLQGLSIEGHLDMEDDTDSPIAKFNKQTKMSKPLLEALTDLKAVIMSAISGEEKPVEKTAEELAAEEEKKKAEMAADPITKPIEPEEPIEPTDLEKELETAKATIVELEAKNADLEAELATFKNDATLMSAQLEEVNTAFSSYKAVKMSSQKLGDTPKVELILTPLEKKQAKFLEDVRSKI
jgi:hypothetical protein